MAEYHYPDEIIFDGDVYDLSYRAKDLQYLRDEYEFDAQDIVVATYPKAGRWYQSYNGDAEAYLIKQFIWDPNVYG